MSNNLKVVLLQLQNATCPESIFGFFPEEDKVKSSFRYIAQVIHPDKNVGSEAEANEAFGLLNKLYQLALKKLDDGTYGDGSVPIQDDVDKPSTPVTITIRDKTFNVGKQIYTGDICDLFECTQDTNTYVLKIASNPADNDLVENEAHVIKELYTVASTCGKMSHYLPKLFKSFLVQSGGERCRANVFHRNDGFYTLADVIKAYKAIDYRDAAWMLNRLLEILGFVHDQKVIHGAVNPDHFIILPAEHRGILIDWCYSQTVTDHKALPLKAIVPAYSDYYPADVLQKNPVSERMDILMALRCYVALIGGDSKTNKFPSTVPSMMVEFIKNSFLIFAGKNPPTAWWFRGEFEKVLTKLVGKRAFRPFTMPS